MFVFFQKLIPQLIFSVLKIFFILIGAYLTNRFFQILIKKIIKRNQVGEIREDRKKRIETFLSIFGLTSRFIIYIISFLLILPELGINITPILTGLGLLSLAVGMAARDVISDFIAGFFIVLENQYQIGDELKIADIQGKVKEISLRRTVIVDENGFSHSISNSHIKLVSKKIK